MFYLAVFFNIGSTSCEKTAKASQTIGLVDNSMTIGTLHRYQALSTRRRARGQRLALVEYYVRDRVPCDVIGELVYLRSNSRILQIVLCRLKTALQRRAFGRIDFIQSREHSA